MCPARCADARNPTACVIISAHRRRQRPTRRVGDLGDFIQVVVGEENGATARCVAGYCLRDAFNPTGIVISVGFGHGNGAACSTGRWRSRWR